MLSESPLGCFCPICVLGVHSSQPPAPGPSHLMETDLLFYPSSSPSLLVSPETLSPQVLPSHRLKPYVYQLTFNWEQGLHNKGWHAREFTPLDGWQPHLGVQNLAFVYIAPTQPPTQHRHKWFPRQVTITSLKVHRRHQVSCSPFFLRH